MMWGNIFQGIPENLVNEHVEDILKTGHVRIERIVSRGHASPDSGWYDQEESEWVMVLQGSGKIVFEDGTECLLNEGDHVTIPARKKHRVAWTDPDKVTLWLAVFYKQI